MLGMAGKRVLKLNSTESFPFYRFSHHLKNVVDR